MDNKNKLLAKKKHGDLKVVAEIMGITPFNAFNLVNRFLPIANQMEYSNNVAILNAIGRKLMNRSAKRRALGGKVTDVWETIAAEVEQLKDDDQWRHTLPSDPRRLQGRYKRYMSEGYTSLIHGNFTNDNIYG